MFFFISIFVIGVNYQDIAFNGAGLSGGGVGTAEQLGGLLAPVSVQNLAALAAMTQPVVTQATQIAPAAAPQPTAPQLCKYIHMNVHNV